MVLITGGTGLVGKHLTSLLTANGYEVAVLSRSPSSGLNVQTYTWDIRRQEISEEALQSAESIIHLAGVNIGGGRWTPGRRREIMASRIETADLLLQGLKETGLRPKTFISASAVGYYGSLTGEKIHSEEEPPALDFPGRVCAAWESAAEKFSKEGIRTIMVRTGIVLSKEGGLLKRLERPIRLGMGTTLGKGHQYMPWIHIDDLCGIYLHFLSNPDLSGAFNAVAPGHATSETFSRLLTRIREKKTWISGVPTFILRSVYGEMASMLLNGSRVSARKIIESGYTFRFPELDGALEQIYAKRVVL